MIENWYRPIGVVLGLALSLSIWQGIQSGDWSAVVFAAGLASIGPALLLGLLFCRAAGLDADGHFDISIALAIGVLVYEIVLLALAFISPFPFYLNVYGLALLTFSSMAMALQDLRE